MIQHFVSCVTRSTCNIACQRLFSSSNFLSADAKWRSQRSLPINPNQDAALRDGADYSFLDGRPTAYGMKQKQRMDFQVEYAKKITQYSLELDEAKEQHKADLELEAAGIRERLSRKLKPKGSSLLKNSLEDGK